MNTSSPVLITGAGNYDRNYDRNYDPFFLGQEQQQNQTDERLAFDIGAKEWHWHQPLFVSLHHKVWDICWKGKLKTEHKVRSANELELIIKQFIKEKIELHSKDLTIEDKADKIQLKNLQKVRAKKIFIEIQKEIGFVTEILKNLSLCEHTLRSHVIRDKGGIDVRDIYKLVNGLIQTYYPQTPNHTTHPPLTEFLLLYDHAETKNRNLINHIIYPKNSNEGEKIINCLKRYDLKRILTMETKIDNLYMTSQVIRQYTATLNFKVAFLLKKIPRENIIRTIYPEDSKGALYAKLEVANVTSCKTLQDTETYEPYLRNLIGLLYGNLNQTEILDSNLISNTFNSLVNGEEFENSFLLKLISIDFYGACYSNFILEWRKKMSEYDLKTKPNTATCFIEFKDSKHCVITISKHFLIMEKNLPLAHISILFETPYETEQGEDLSVKMRFGEFYLEPSLQDEYAVNKQALVMNFDAFLRHYKS